MLDQNTDRSWWMIGAVVVGAAIISVALFVFPDTLEQIIDKFNGQIDGVNVAPQAPGS